MFLTIGGEFYSIGVGGKEVNGERRGGMGFEKYGGPKGHDDQANARARRRDGRRAGCRLAWQARRQCRQARLKGKIGSDRKAAKRVDGKRVGDETAGVGAGDASGRGGRRKRAAGQRPLPMQRRRFYSASAVLAHL